REQMLAWLQESDVHPTAGQIHTAVLREFPRLSLATVYRNLEVLVEEGSVKVVPCGNGAVRYDGNLDPHHHFVCEACDRIIDVPLAEPRALCRRLAREYALRAGRVSMIFYGKCPDCDCMTDVSGSRTGEEVSSNSLD
ncbi:transcriptional repressor, partial [Myxococcota bacterium]|nr:transcriptional repressor [Myxococcota bacterium]